MREQAGDRVQRGHLQRRVVVELGKHRRQALGQHGLARARRTEQRHVVPAGGRDLDRPAAEALAGDVGEVGHGLGRWWRVVGRVEQRPVLADERHQPVERVDGPHPYPRDDRRLAGVAPRHDRAGDAGAGGGRDHRQHTADRPHGAVEAQLTEDRHALQRAERQLAGRAEERRGDREVVARAELGHRRRQQVDGDPPVGPLLAGVDDRGTHPVAGLVERRVGQAGKHDGGQPDGQVGLDLDEMTGHADEADGERLRVRHMKTFPRYGRSASGRFAGLWTTGSPVDGHLIMGAVCYRHGVQNAPRRCSTSVGASRRTSTDTTSKRTSAGCAPVSASHWAASRRRRRALACTTAPAGGP